MMLLNNPIAYGQAESRSITHFMGGEKGFELSLHFVKYCDLLFFYSYLRTGQMSPHVLCPDKNSQLQQNPDSLNLGSFPNK
jgi:hypothetical protein